MNCRAVAADHLQDVLDSMHALAWREPLALDAQHHLAEAYVLRGQLEHAESVLDELEAGGRPLHRTRSNAGALRVRGLIAVRGETSARPRSCSGSRWPCKPGPEPHESGRTLLHLGTVLRRGSRKRDAREALEEAARTLDGGGSPVCADRARSELDRISGRPLRDDFTKVTLRE